MKIIQKIISTLYLLTSLSLLVAVMGTIITISNPIKFYQFYKNGDQFIKQQVKIDSFRYTETDEVEFVFITTNDIRQNQRIYIGSHLDYSLSHRQDSCFVWYNKEIDKMIYAIPSEKVFPKELYLWYIMRRFIIIIGLYVLRKILGFILGLIVK